MKEFDIFVPLTFNDGSPIPDELFDELELRLLTQFRGMTYFPQANQGFWKLADVTYQDEIVIYRILTGEVRASREYLSALKKWMKSVFEQEEILIIERTVGTIR